MSKYSSEMECAKALVALALAKGYAISVYDGEATTVRKSNDAAVISNALHSVDRDELRFYRIGTVGMGDGFCGLMVLIWGNDPHGRELIADYTDNQAMNELVDELDADAEEPPKPFPCLSYRDMAKRAKPEVVADLAYILLRIYEANRTKNNGAVTGEATICQGFAAEAKDVLERSGVLTA